jgi:hypothetical protein
MVSEILKGLLFVLYSFSKVLIPNLIIISGPVPLTGYKTTGNFQKLYKQLKRLDAKALEGNNTDYGFIEQ